MAQYDMLVCYITTHGRGVNGSDVLPGSTITTTFKTWPAAAAAFKQQVYDTTAANGMLDTRAGHEAAHAAQLATFKPMTKRDHDKVVNLFGRRVRLIRRS